MLAKITARNQLTLPQSALEAVGSPSHFEVQVDGGRIVLTPSGPDDADAVRRSLEALGLKDKDVADAIAWARRGG